MSLGGDGLGIEGLGGDSPLPGSGYASLTLSASGAARSKYTAAVLTDAPLVYWRMGESSGTTMLDSSGNARDGNYSTTKSAATGLLAADGDAAHSSGYGAIGAASWLDVNSITIECWVSPVGSNNNKGIVARFAGSGNPWLLWFNTSSQIAVRFYNAAGSQVDLVWATPPTAGVTYHVVATYTSGRARLYINNVEVASSTSLTGNLRTSSNAVTTRLYQDFAIEMGGTLDEVALYDGELSPDRVAAHYVAGAGIPVIASDTFNRANGALGTADVGGAWSTLSGTFTIASNVASVAADGAVAVLPVTALDVVVSTVYQSMGALSGDFEGVLARCTNLSNFYLAQASGVGVVQLFKCVAGSFTQLGSSTSSGAIAAGQILALDVTGTTVRALVNGASVISVTDSALTTGSPGIRSGGGNTKTFENFLVTGTRVAVSATASLSLSAVVAPLTGTASLSLSATHTKTPLTSSIMGLSNLLGYWRLGERSGASTAIDSSGNARHLTYNSATLGQPGLVAGDTDTAASFPSGGSNAIISHNTWMDASTQTVFAVIKPASVSTGIHQVIACIDQAGNGAQLSFRLFQLGTNLACYVNGPTLFLSSSGPLAVGVTATVAFVHDGTNAYLYVNGAQVATIASTIATKTGPFVIGNYGFGGAQFLGDIDELAFAGTAASGATITQLHNDAMGITGYSGTASLTLTASGTVVGVSGGATASLSLSGSGGTSAATSASASLSLTGVQSVLGTASLSLSATGVVAVPVSSATSSLSLSGSATAGAAPTGSASLSFVLSSGYVPAAGDASLTLSGSAGASGGTVGSASLNLSGTGGAGVPTGSAALSLSAVGVMPTFPIAVASLTSGLTGWWRLNETGGTTAADSSGSSHPLTYSGSYTLGSSGAMVDGGNDLAVTLSGGQVSTGHASWMNTSAVTAFVVMQPSTVSGTGTIICIDDVGGGGQLSWRVQRAGNRINAFYSGDPGGVGSTAGSIVANSSYTVAYVNNGTTEKIYLNGVEAGTASASAIPVGTGGLRIGALSSGAEAFAGKIDEALLWSTALSPTDILNLHVASGVPVAATATASLSLSASGGGHSGRASNVTALLSTTATGAARARIDGNAVIEIYEAGAARSGTASLTFSANSTALPATARTGTALLSFTSTGAGVNSTRTGTGSLTVSATGVSPQYRTATGSISFSATGVSPQYRSATATLTLIRTTGNVGVGRLGSASITLVASPAVAGVARTASGSISFSGAGVFPSRSGTASLSLVMPPRSIVAGLVITQGVGEITLPEELVLMTSELRLTLLETVIRRAPAELTVVLSGAVAQEDVVFSIDGTDVYTVSADSSGGLGPTTINVSAALGTAGVHTLTASQVGAVGTVTDSATFTVTLDPAVYPGPPVVDAPPVIISAPVVDTAQHWVLQDLLPIIDGGLGSYVFPHNPATMTSPHYEHALTAKHSTAGDGKNHVYQGGGVAKEWTFTGYCPSEAHQAAITAYRNLNRRFWLIDHRNRAWMVMFNDAQFVPRKRQNYNGVDTDWGSDFTVTAIVLDQNFTVPS